MVYWYHMVVSLLNDNDLLDSRCRLFQRVAERLATPWPGLNKKLAPKRKDF